jgi:hypothetical protein
MQGGHPPYAASSRPSVAHRHRDAGWKPAVCGLHLAVCGLHLAVCGLQLDVYRLQIPADGRHLCVCRLQLGVSAPHFAQLPAQQRSATNKLAGC